MTSALQNSIRDLLRDIGPSTLEEILERLAGTQLLLASKNPAGMVRNALTNDPACQSAGDSRYVYLPAFVHGASVRASMDLAAPRKGVLAAGAEVSALLWPVEGWGAREPVPAVSLEGGPTVALESLESRFGGGLIGLHVLLRLPAPFWRWWEERRRAGHDALLLRCEDAEAGRFAIKSVRTATLDPSAVANRNSQLQAAAAAMLKRSRGLAAENLARRLLARGVYHGEPSPDPLATVLFEPDQPFFLEGMDVTYRAEMTPALRRLFAPRFAMERLPYQAMLRQSLGLPPLPASQPESKPQPAPERAPELGYRIKVSLQWRRGVWRIFEILSSQTLKDLHVAIRRAFGWEPDHLYAFFMSGRAWDRRTEIEGPFGEAEPPTADEVTLAELGLGPSQSFLYLYDFGDELRHQVEVLGTFSPVETEKYPRISESRGASPGQ